VSRVGGNAQIKAMKEVAGSLRLDLAAYRELEAFAQLGTELDPASQRQLDRGARMVQLLKQGQCTPYSMVDQAISIFAASKGVLDDIPVAQVHAFEKDLLESFAGPHKGLREELIKAKSFQGGLDARFEAAVKEFKKNWTAPAKA
jgi:F-type H+-transporting ATPase subunit alpha